MNSAFPDVRNIYVHFFLEERRDPMAYKNYLQTSEFNQWIRQAEEKGINGRDFEGFYVRPEQKASSQQRQQYQRARENSMLENIARGLQQELDAKTLFSTEEKTAPYRSIQNTSILDEEFDDDFDYEHPTLDLTPIGGGSVGKMPALDKDDDCNDDRYIDFDSLDTFDDLFADDFFDGSG